MNSCSSDSQKWVVSKIPFFQKLGVCYCSTHMKWSRNWVGYGGVQFFQWGYTRHITVITAYNHSKRRGSTQTNSDLHPKLLYSGQGSILLCPA